MNRRQLAIRALLGLVAALLAWLGIRRRNAPQMDKASPFDRVVFVCCDDHGDYSPGVYLHGPAGGGPACLSLAREAAHGMRSGEPGDSAAGFCGYLFQQLGAHITAGGGLSLLDAPRPGPGGAVDWQGYCSWNVDLVLVNVDRGTAECFVSPADPEALSKVLAGRLTDLKFGG